MDEVTNADRVERVSQALELYDDPNDLRSNVVDILADLMHIWGQEGVDEPFHALISSAAIHHAAELDEELDEELPFVKGNVVYWTDPDNGEGSGYYRVVEVNDDRKELELDSDLDAIKPTAGITAHYIECTVIGKA